MGDLKPCPFCGGEASAGYFAMIPNIGCDACQYSLDGEQEERPGEKAQMEILAAAWNRRATTPEVTAMVEALWFIANEALDMVSAQYCARDALAKLEAAQ